MDTESEETSRNVLTIPAKPLLTAEQLIELRSVEVKTTRAGLKRTQPDGSVEELEEIRRFEDELRSQLSLQRIERISVRTIGEWNPAKQAVKVVRKEKKFDTFGYSDGGAHYLDYFEALFLLELNRLEIYLENILVSTEQAYQLLLGEQCSRKYHIYLVYATLSRTGYIVQKYEPEFEPQATEVDCIWEILRKSLNDKYVLPSHVRNHEKRASIEESFRIIKDRTTSNSHSEAQKETEQTLPLIDFERKIAGTRKRKAESSQEPCDSTSTKISRWSNNQTSSESFLNFLKSEPEYQHADFRKIFDSIDIIRLDDSISWEDPNCRDLQIDFDVFLPNEGYKKSERTVPPALRVVISGPSELLPSRSEIAKCYHSQKFKVPLVVVSISESKQVQGFIYHFT